MISGEAPVHAAERQLPVLSDVESSFYLHLEVADEPGVLAQVAKVLAEAGISVKSVVQKGMGNDARLVMVVHRCPEKLFTDTVAEIGRLGSLRSGPRFIRVIEEEFV